MPKTELIEMKVFKGFEKVQVSGKPGTTIITPSNPELRLYALTYGRYVEVQSRYSRNPYWYPADTYESRDGDKILREASVCVTNETVRGRSSNVGFFKSRDEYLEMMKFYFNAEIISSVVEE